MDDILANFGSRSPLPSADESAVKPLRVVGIGAGAGGLEAVQLLFGAMPANIGLAFVICRFVEPGLADPLAELLRAQTTLTIVHGEDDTLLEPDHIYLVPPSGRMIILNQTLVSFADNDDAADVLPIDLLLHSLAASAGPSAIAVLLSGNGEDGLRGADSIRRFGGLVLAQHPESTEYGAMPRRVIEADLASTVAPPGAMPDLIWRQIGKVGSSGDQTTDGGSEEEALARIIGLLQARLGVDGRAYRPSLVAKRVRRRFGKSCSTTLADYAERLAGDQAELQRLHDDLLIGVTAFFRDPEAFAALESDVAPILVARMSPERPLRIWVPGCATGEEAYSLAMMFLGQIECAAKTPHLEVIASDRHARALKQARHGRYRRERIGSVPPALVARYMVEQGDHLEIGADLRRHVTFVEHDLLQTSPPDDVDLVSCRNLIIYLAASSREQALTACSDALRPDGFMFLGPSEQPGRLMDGLITVNAKWRIYGRTPPAASDPDPSLDRLAEVKRRHPAETILPPVLDEPLPARPSSPDVNVPDKVPKADYPADLDSVLVEHQRMLESTIDTLLASNDALRRRNRDLRVENQRLVAAHAALDDVATMIAHDLKAPLRATERLFLQLRESTSAAVGRDETARCLRPIQIQLLGLDRLIDDLLTYARQGRPESADLQLVDMGDLLRETLTLIGLPKGTKVMMQPSSLRITTWRTPLACILRNLLGHAIERIGGEPGSIRIDVTSAEHILEVVIVDDGKGMPEPAGGLGHAIVRQLLDSAGGRISFGGDRSKPESEARFTWPIASATAPEASQDDIPQI